MESLFYRIDHKTYMKVFDNETLIQIKSFLFGELASNEELFIGNTVTISNLFTKLLRLSNLPSDTSLQDKISQMFKLSEQYTQSILNSTETSPQSIFTLCQRVSLRNYKMTFTFTSEFVKEIATLLTNAYSKIKALKQQYNISYTDLLSNLQTLSNENVDLITKYRQSNVRMEDVEDEFIIPNEMILLMNIFQKIKKLEMCLDENSISYLEGCLLILMNAEWMFPYVFEIEFDLTCEKVVMKMLEEFHMEGCNNIEKNVNRKSYVDMVKCNQNVFDLIIVYTHFITQFQYLNNLNIVFPTSFKSEIETILHNTENDNKSTIYDFHFFDFLLNINHLRVLSITFNSLERESFEKLLSVIQNNSSLNALSIQFFINKNEYYTTKSLLKIAEENGLNINTILNKYSFSNYEENITQNTILLNSILINKLIPHFESNIEKLFLIIQSKKNLSSLSLNFNLPSLIENNEKYFLILMKLTFNIFLMLNREKFHMKELKLISPLLKFNNKSLINNFLQEINLYHKNQSLTMFHFQIDMNSIINVPNVLSKHLTYLFLGDLDDDVLQSFINVYQSDGFRKDSQLETVCISIKKSICEYNNESSIKEKVNCFFNGRNPYKVKEIEFYSHLQMKLRDLEEMLQYVNGNNIMKYTLQIQQENKIDFLKFKFENYFYFNDKSKKSIQPYLIISKKLHHLPNNTHKRYFLSNILSFIVNIEQKDILLSNKE